MERKRWKRSHSSDSDSVALMTPFTTPIFDFHLVTSPLTTPLTTPTPTPTPSLVKTSLKKASAVDPENWLGLLIDRASRKICFSQSKALPRSGQ